MIPPTFNETILWRSYKLSQDGKHLPQQELF
jgi:hypothetical protein